MEPSEQIDRYIAELVDWRGQALAAVRAAILGADPAIVEQWKWRGSPVWALEGNLIVGNAHNDKIKLTFSHGASLDDPDKLFNNGFNGNVWRSIDIFEADRIDIAAFQALVRRAVAYNQAKPKKKTSAKTKS